MVGIATLVWLVRLVGLVGLEMRLGIVAVLRVTGRVGLVALARLVGLVALVGLVGLEMRLGIVAVLKVTRRAGLVALARLVGLRGVHLRSCNSDNAKCRRTTMRVQLQKVQIRGRS